MPGAAPAGAGGAVAESTRDFHAASARWIVLRRNCRPLADFAADGQEISHEGAAAFAAAPATGLNVYGSSVKSQSSNLPRGQRVVRRVPDGRSGHRDAPGLRQLVAQVPRASEGVS